MWDAHSLLAFRKVGIESHSLGLFQATLREAETSLALGNSCSHQLWVGFIRPARSFLAVASLNVNYGNQLPLFYFYLRLFSFVYLCLLLFIQTGIPLGSECELWKSVAFISIYTYFLLFTYVYFCLSKHYSSRYPNWIWIMEIRCLCFTFVLIYFFVYLCLLLFIKKNRYSFGF